MVPASSRGKEKDTGEKALKKNSYPTRGSAKKLLSDGIKKSKACTSKSRRLRRTRVVEDLIPEEGVIYVLQGVSEIESRDIVITIKRSC